MTEQQGPEWGSAERPEHQQFPTTPPSFDKGPQQLPPAPAGYHYAAPDEPNAQTSLIVGVLGLLLGFTCGVGFIASPFALVMGWKSKKRIAESGGALGGESNAQAGFILGIVGTVILALLVIALFFLVLILILVVDWSTNSTPSIGIAT